MKKPIQLAGNFESPPTQLKKASHATCRDPVSWKPSNLDYYSRATCPSSQPKRATLATWRHLLGPDCWTVGPACSVGPTSSFVWCLGWLPPRVRESFPNFPRPSPPPWVISPPSSRRRRRATGCHQLLLPARNPTQRTRPASDSTGPTPTDINKTQTVRFLTGNRQIYASLDKTSGHYWISSKSPSAHA